MKKTSLWVRGILLACQVLLVLLTLSIAAYADEEGGGIVDAIAALGKKVVDIIIGIAAVVAAVVVAYRAAWGEFEIGTGNPYGLSRTWTAIAGVLICFVVAALAILIVNNFVDMISGYIPTEGIHIPTGG